MYCRFVTEQGLGVLGREERLLVDDSRLKGFGLGHELLLAVSVDEDPGQQKLFEIHDDDNAADGSEQEETADSPPKKRRRGHGRRRFPDLFPRRPIVCELSDEERVCPCCGKLRTKVSEEVSEQLEFQPASFYVNKHIRYVYACQNEACTPNMATAAKPPQPIEKGAAGPGLLSFVATSKLAESA